MYIVQLLTQAIATPTAAATRLDKMDKQLNVDGGSAAKSVALSNAVSAATSTNGRKQQLIANHGKDMVATHQCRLELSHLGT